MKKWEKLNVCIRRVYGDVLKFVNIIQIDLRHVDFVRVFFVGRYRTQNSRYTHK